MQKRQKNAVMRKKGVELAIVRSLISELVLRGEIKTTERRAKKVRPQVERMVNLVEARGLGGMKTAVALMGNRKEIGKRLKEVVVPQLAGRRSGFVRIVRLGRRQGDGAMMVRMTWVEEIEKKKKEGGRKKSTGMPKLSKEGGAGLAEKGKSKPKVVKK